MKVYTKTGDNGTTSLIGGRRVSKADNRIEAYGTVDELSANIAFLRDNIISSNAIDGSVISQELSELFEVLHRLMVVSALLASDGSMYDKLPKISDENILMLENGIDRMSNELMPITRFTIPGGDPLVSLCHISRTVCRRAERAIIRAKQDDEVDKNVMEFINRLSDYLYVLGRLLSSHLEIKEQYWEGD